MRIVLKCPACREKFKYDVSHGWPDECPICHTDINNRRDDDDVVMPNILSFRTKNTDKVARDIRDGSVQRAEMAAAMAGTRVEDMSALKITNLTDRKDAQFATQDEADAAQPDGSHKCPICQTFSTDHEFFGDESSDFRCYECDMRSFSHR